MGTTPVLAKGPTSKVEVVNVMGEIAALYGPSQNVTWPLRLVYDFVAGRTISAVRLTFCNSAPEAEYEVATRHVKLKVSEVGRAATVTAAGIA